MQNKDNSKLESTHKINNQNKSNFEDKNIKNKEAKKTSTRANLKRERRDGPGGN